MCGISGLVARRSRNLDAVFAMNTAQEHRGPDGEGFLFVDGLECHGGFSPEAVFGRTLGQVALGHRRLAILDPTEAGLQPMSSPDGQMWVAHNGEIYNYLELREELRALGHTFQTETDTEVILAAYAEFGADCFTRFNGMWATSIWDNRTRRLILSRDRFGIKPLHLARLDDGLAFASEIKGILASGLVRPRLNHDAATQFLRWANTNTTTETMFGGIDAFPPGHVAIIDPDRPTAWEPKPYYRLVDQLPTGSSDALSAVGAQEASEHFRELFCSAVELRMRSDVPVGSCLSGGLDSSSVVCAASRDVDVSLDTFTSGFDIRQHDERQWSDLVNRAVGATPHPVRPTAADFESELPALVWHQEEPFGSTSIYAQWCLMREARRNDVPVLLDGQGGDEILCGYRKYYMFYLKSLVSRRRLVAAAREAAGLVRHGDRNQWNVFSAGSRYLPGPLQDRVWSIESSIRPRFQSQWNRSESGLGLSGSDITARQIADLERFSVPPLLRYEDRNSMAWSIEARVPFLDHRLVELAVGLPIERKLSGGVNKAVLRDAMRGIVPDAVLNRNDKLGFTTPMVEWLGGELRPLAEKRLGRNDFYAAPLIDGQHLVAELDGRLAKDDADGLAKIFRVLAFDAWAEQFEVEL